MAAGIAVAWALGDERAQDLAQAFQERRQWHKAPPLEFGSVAAIESMMWRDVHRYRPL